ncbi:MAG: EAL domain-containing protein [Burkholderiales bacterium]|nr:EAL domain-containing protein [Burkholderiales bacterium]MDE2276092.1 EAL domain-containing protein [Burkholderiales bacterium]
MHPCPVPSNEAERLAAVHAYQILDTAPEVEFDVTTRIAASLFNAPIALVALMDRDRLWFKSRHGLDVDQLDRQIAFCAHAIVQPEELLVINDLRQDSRFDANPLVHGAPGIRFYAGAPLRDARGLALGTLAVLATEPREFSAVQRELLRDLSVSVMTAIESRHRALVLKEMATTDSLTGLANRIQFQSAIALAFRQAEQAGQSVALLSLDLDGFKGVNDSLGHGAGDAVLREVARRLSLLMRNGETLARLGGDEFAIVMRGGPDRRGAQALAERIVEALQRPVVLPGGEEVPVAVSIGIAWKDGRTADAAGLIEQSDHALYKAKRQASQRWAVFDDPARPVLVVPPSAYAELADADGAASRCEACGAGAAQPFPFTMAFQPIVSASRRQVFAYEALVRGLDGESATTVLARVTRRNRYAFDQSCRRTAIELAAKLGLIERGACLSINFIPGAMYEPENCVRATLAAARRAKLPADRLIFEVTEGEEVLVPSHLAKIFDVYRRHGFRPAIDDFGAGYAGLNLLAEFQPSLIKLDRKLIQDIDASRPKQSIVRGVLSVCSDLGITPIAEGVETEGEYRSLRALGIDLFQGYLFARPAFEALPEPMFPG